MRSGPLERRPGLVHRYGMDGRGWIGRHGFWPLALLWLPGGIVAQAAVRFGPSGGPPDGPHFWPAALTAAGSLALVAVCGMPLALGCRRLWRLRYRRTAWAAGIALGAVTVAVSVVAGLLGPVAIAIYAIVVSLSVWRIWWWLARRG